ncbi:hypothetical protein UFOVP74_35 [uncultured Caudovirales phage]|uniref:Uncharacterized protein n=1 Tax=uncultured Caudovirales phage TaxID=2100421 RepID=A0A6J5KWQ6_9CAUD|nr:hypothetical protein UFOVP74_35 [uncultured Caudovirales phage]
MKPLYRFALVNAAGQYLFNDNRSIGLSDTAVYLKDMISWEEWAYNLKRHERLLGVYQYYKPETVLFCGDMETVLRLMFNNGELLAGGYLLVQELDTTTMTYSDGERFQLDWEMYRAHELWVEIMIIHGGAAEAITGYEDTIYEIPLTDSSHIVHMDGVVMLGAYAFQGEAGGTLSLTVYASDADPYYQATFGTVYLDHEGTLTPAQAQSATTGMEPGVGTFADAWILDGLFAGTYTIEFNAWQLIYTFTNSVSTVRSKLKIQYLVYSGASWGGSPTIGTIWEGDYIDASAAPVTIADQITATSPEITIGEDEYLVVVFTLLCESIPDGGGYNNCAIQLPPEPQNFYIKHTSRAAATPCRAISAKDLFYAICNRLPGYERDGISDLLGSTDSYYGLAPNELYFTCTDAVREIYADADGNAYDPVIRKSLKGLMKDLFAVLGGVGLGVKIGGDGAEVIVLDRLEYFYDRGSTPIEITSFSDEYDIYPWNQNRGGNLTFGYKEQTYDAVNGRYEFNQPQIYRSNITYKMPDIDYTAESRADPYGIETLRANLSDKKTMDSSSDNDVIMLAVNATPDERGLYLLKRGVPIISGLPAPVISSIYNVELTPKHCMLRLERYLVTQYGGVGFTMVGANPTISIQTSSKNQALKWLDVDSEVTYRECYDYTMGVDVRQYHACRKIKIEVDVSKEVMAQLVANPYKLVSLKNFRYKGAKFDLLLFVDDIQRQPGTKQAYLIEGTIAADQELPGDF